jgi:hypothetical protein
MKGTLVRTTMCTSRHATHAYAGVRSDISAVKSVKESRSIKKRAASAGIEEISVVVHLLQYVREKLEAMK